RSRRLGCLTGDELVPGRQIRLECFIEQVFEYSHQAIACDYTRYRKYAVDIWHHLNGMFGYAPKKRNLARNRHRRFVVTTHHHGIWHNTKSTEVAQGILRRL